MRQSCHGTAPHAGKRLLALQCVVLCAAALVFALLPPDKGPVLLVSLRGNAAARLLGSNMRLLGAGRLHGSLVAIGAHPSFMDGLMNHGVLVLPALPVLCGSVGNLES